MEQVFEFPLVIVEDKGVPNGVASLDEEGKIPVKQLPDNIEVKGHNHDGVYVSAKEINNLKKSVSDGKTAVANAITAKGITTATDATFAVMAENIGQIETSKSPFNIFTQITEPISKDGVWIQTNNQYENIIIDSKYYSDDKVWTSVGTLPYDFSIGSAVVYNNEIHILGGNGGGRINHYKWNGTSWTSVGTLPYNFYSGSAVVLNNEIHILGGSGNKTNHYKWNGSEWVNVSTLPYNFYSGSAVVLNNEIHILGGSGNKTNHYKWNGSEWVNVSTLPYNFYSGSAVVCSDGIHILGGGGGSTKHYKWDGTSWTSVGTLPYNFSIGSAVVYNNEIHILGGNGGGSTKHYKWDGTSWTSVGTLPYSFSTGSAVVYNNEIHILGGNGSGSNKNHYKESMITDTTSENTVIINQLNSNENGTYVTNLIHGANILASNNKFPSGFDDIIYRGPSSLEEVPMYYGNGYEWIKFKN